MALSKSALLDENGFVVLYPNKPAQITAVARYHFDGFGGSSRSERGDEIVLLNYHPSQPQADSPSAQHSADWCVGKRAMDGVKGVVYLPALKIPSSTTSSPPINSPSGPRRGRLFITPPHQDDVGKEKAEEGEEEPGRKGKEGDEQLFLTEEDEPTLMMHKEEHYGPQVLGFVLVLFSILFILGSRGEAGWELALLGFVPRLLALFDRLVHRRFL